MRQQQLLVEKRSYANLLKQKIGSHVTTRPTISTTIRTTQSTTTQASTTQYIPPRKKVSRYQLAGGHKVSPKLFRWNINCHFYFQLQVMNAPKEYYPVGYDKNFDDDFKSKVDLPTTSFHCGDQKHFPGLYADEDLGCMVSWQLFPLRYLSLFKRMAMKFKSWYIDKCRPQHFSLIVLNFNHSLSEFIYQTSYSRYTVTQFLRVQGISFHKSSWPWVIKCLHHV